jgi:hypothetical protein
MSDLQPMTGEIHICHLPGGRRRSDRLYYYQGNFFHPLELGGSQVGLVKGAIRKFERDNAEMIARDRAHPDYKTILELFDMPPPAGAGGEV